MKKILQTWLFRQCRMLSGSIRAVLLTCPLDEGPYVQASSWPDDRGDYATLSSVAQAALRSQKSVIKTRNHRAESTGEPLDALACPLFLEGRLLGVVAIEMTHRSQSMQRATLQQVQVGAQWLENMILLDRATSKEQLVNLVDLVVAGLEHEQFKVAATEVTNVLAERFGCHRVSMGFLHGRRVRVEALSHSTRIDQQSTLIRAIRDAMSESLDQGVSIVYPASGDGPAVRFHDQLAHIRQKETICTLPLIKNGKAVGALLLERDADRPFRAETVGQCEQIGLLLGPMLETRRREERPLPVKILESLRKGCVNLFGPRHLLLKIGVGLTAVLLTWLCIAGSTLRISCDSVIEASVCRAVVAPQQGYISEAYVRAGDLLREGELLATLDDRELRLEQRKLKSLLDQLLKEYRQALAVLDRAEVAILKAKRMQAEAELRLIEQQLARTRLVAPFSGVVLKGDLSQALGSPVAPGEVLYEIAPTDAYRVVMKIDDRDIGLVALGQRGKLKLSGIPDQTIAVTINRLTPVSTTEEGRNYFRVEAAMGSYSDLMRPGMEGIVRIEIGREKLLRVCTRRLVDWLRLFIWTRLP